MNQKIFIIAGVILVIVVGAIFILTSEPKTEPYQTEQLIIEQDLTPIELSSEEQQTLQEEGLVIPSGEDILAKDLQDVRSSDELDAIEADLNETDLSGLDLELELISEDLLGL